MESNQLNNEDLSNDAIIELLTLTCKISKYGSKRYYNKNGELHRIHGPAVITVQGTQFWYKDGMRHREDGPAMEWSNSNSHFYINNKLLSKEAFIQWQKDNGI